MDADKLAAIQGRIDAPHAPLTCNKNCVHLAHQDVPALVAEVTDQHVTIHTLREDRNEWARQARTAETELLDERQLVQVRTAERDRARRWAVHLEQENAEKDAAIERVLTYAASLLVRHPGMTVTADVVWQLHEHLKLDGQPEDEGTKRRYHCPRCGDMQVCARCEPELAAEVHAEREVRKPEYVEGVEPCADHSRRTVYYCCTPPASGQPADGGTE